MDRAKKQQEIKETEEALKRAEVDQKQTTMALITMKLSKGKPALLAMGFKEADIDEAIAKRDAEKNKKSEVTEPDKLNKENIDENNAEKIKQEKMNAVMQQIMLYMENERKEKEEEEKENQKELEQLEANKNRLAELIELREKLALEENVRGSAEENKSLTQEGQAKTETKENLKEKSFQLTENDFEWSYPKNYLEQMGKFYFTIEGKKEMVTIEEHSYEYKKASLFTKVISLGETRQKLVKMKNPYWIVKHTNEKLEGKYPSEIKCENREMAILKTSEIVSEVKKYIEEEISTDRKEKPFLYYAFEKSANPILLEKNKNTTSGSLDLRNIEKEWTEIAYNFLQKTGENEGFFEYNIFGFIKIIKNVNEIRNKDGINSMSEKAVYKIIGPDGTIVADNINGYEKASEIYHEATEKYKKEVEEEFNNLDNK